MRAPPASNRPMIGARAFIAMSWILMIFCACVSESEPPNTVKSLANTNTVRPFTVPQPVTTPSPGIFGCLVHAEVGRAVLDEHVELLERVLVHQQFDALARGELAALVLRLDARLPAAGRAFCAPHFELFEDVLHASVRPLSTASHCHRRANGGQSMTTSSGCPEGPSRRRQHAHGRTPGEARAMIEEDIAARSCARVEGCRRSRIEERRRPADRRAAGSPCRGRLDLGSAADPGA